jgi:RTX calcium-binding nonapeptide repeat (4 copies)
VACPAPPDPPTPDCPEGARFNTGMRRQTFEPTPLGFSIQNQETGADESHARQYDIGIDAWEAAGGRTAGTSADSGERDAQPVYDRVTLGELPLGAGQIRIAGALLPQPSQEFDHTLGLEPFATTYTGYTLICNLLDCTVRTSAGGAGPEPEPGPEPGPGIGGPEQGGGPCSNVIHGDGGNNKLGGTAGSDRITGGSGRDRIKGRAGDDCLRGGRGKDKIGGGAGDDKIHVAAGRRDKVNCGSGKDKVNAGRKDKVRNCEKVS